MAFLKDSVVQITNNMKIKYNGKRQTQNSHQGTQEFNFHTSREDEIYEII